MTHDGDPTGTVVAVHRAAEHTFSKEVVEAITLTAGLGVDGDAHRGATVQHLSRVRVDPDQPNLRQVHLIHDELLGELDAAGHAVAPGALGENITTAGVDLLGLPTGTTLRIGPDALVTLTGLRNPCRQIEAFSAGLLGEVLQRDDEGTVVRRAGVMGVVVRSGAVRPGDDIAVALPPPPHHPLERI